MFQQMDTLSVAARKPVTITRCVMRRLLDRVRGLIHSMHRVTAAKVAWKHGVPAERKPVLSYFQTYVALPETHFCVKLSGH